MVDQVTTSPQGTTARNQVSNFNQAMRSLNRVFNGIGENDDHSRQRFGNFALTLISQFENSNVQQANETLRNSVITDNGILGFVPPNERAAFANNLWNLQSAYRGNPNLRPVIRDALLTLTPQGQVLQAVSDRYSALTPNQRQQLVPHIRTLTSVIGPNAPQANQWNNLISTIDQIDTNLGLAVRDLGSSMQNMNNRTAANIIISGLSDLISEK